MTRKAIVLLGLLALLVTPAVAIPGGDSADDLTEGQSRVAIKVTGMTCGGCCVKVETAVNELEGVVDVTADYENGVTTVVYETEKLEVNQIVKAINDGTSFKAEMPEEQAS